MPARYVIVSIEVCSNAVRCGALCPWGNGDVCEAFRGAKRERVPDTISRHFRCQECLHSESQAEHLQLSTDHDHAESETETNPASK